MTDVAAVQCFPLAERVTSTFRDTLILRGFGVIPRFSSCCGRLLFPCKRYSNTGLYAYFGDECQFALSAKPKRDLDAFEAQSFGTLVKALRQTSFRHQRRVEDEVKALPGPTRGSYPRVVIPHAEAGKGLTIVMHQRLGEFEDQRVSGIKGYIHLTA